MDDAGRSIKERLQWQAYLGNKLPEHIHTPKIIDAFEIDGDFYLVTQCIKGDSLDEVLTSIYNGVGWRSLVVVKKLEILSLLAKIVDLVADLHRAGYIHRDVTPGNFLFTKNGMVHPIDLELMYSLERHFPNPPFRFGTPGYVSPEQQSSATPTAKEDIYAIGGLMIAALIRLAPLRIEQRIRRPFGIV
ncbi:protein kinase domain-containing protein [Puia sp. P3]|uniref:protein kinase domain-containing protein n=1 Tax=Puia sp. P3 TaxID=3423952 RepID=UPI003D6702C4